MKDKTKKIITKEITEKTTETIIEESVPESTYPDIIEAEIEKDNIESTNKIKQLNLEEENIDSNKNKGPLVQLCDKIRKFWIDNFLIKDIDIIDIPLAVALSHGLPDDPVWLIIISQSSGLKSEIIRSFGDEPTPFIIPVSKITANAIMSGSKGGDCLAYDAHNKILMIKDLTTVLESRPEIVAAVASQLREMYDGYISVASGLSGGSKHTKVNTTIIAGVTPDAIDSTRIFKSEMGERVIYKRFPEFDSKTTEKMKETLINQSLASSQNRNEIRDLMNKFIEQIFIIRKNNKKYENMPITDKESFGKIVDLATLIAQLRRGAKWNYRGTEIEDIGTPEAPYRLAKQLFKLTICIKNVKGNEKIDNDVMRSVVRVGMDSIPRKRYIAIMPILRFYEDYKNLSENELKERGIHRSLIRYYAKNLMGISSGAINRALDELEEFNVLESDTTANDKWYRFTRVFMDDYASILGVLSDIYNGEKEFNKVDIIFK